MIDAPQANMVRVGVFCEGSPTGGIFVSQALIAQRGMPFVRRMVRETFDAAHKAARRERERCAAINTTRRA